MPKEIQRKAVILLALALLGSTGLLGQLGNLTVLERDRLVSAAESQRTEYLRVKAPRGNILDRDGRPLATNRPANTVYVQWPHYREPALMDRLAQILGEPPETLAELARRRLKEGPLWEPVRVKDDITPRQWALLLEHQDELPGVAVEVQPVRDYPGGSLAAHVLGYVGAVNEEEWRRLRSQGYRGDDMIGKSGLEARYEPYLRGREGERRVEVDQQYRPLGEASRTREPEPGNSLVLTIDQELQAAVERSLDWNIFRIAHSPHAHEGRQGRPELHPANAGAVVVLDVHTGAVLALVSRPAFDPNLFITRRPAGALEAVLTDPLAPQWNRATRAAYHPGSAWKMVTATAALMTGVVGPNERVLSTSTYEPTGQKEWRQGGHGLVDVVSALRISSNVFFYEMGRRLGIDRLVEYAAAYGFGARTGIDLEEVSGFLPDAAYRATLKDGWYLGQTTSAAIGQVFEATPLQLARYAAAIANGGQVLKPYLVQRVEDPDGHVLTQTAPQVVSEIPVQPAFIQLIQKGMRAADSPGGTSDFGRFPLPGISTAGKTGTAQNPGKDDFGVYVGYAPADMPEIAVAVVIENGGHGGWVGPVARAAYAQYFGVALSPTDPARAPDNFPAQSAELGELLRQTMGRRWWPEGR